MYFQSIRRMEKWKFLASLQVVPSMPFILSLPLSSPFPPFIFPINFSGLAFLWLIHTPEHALVPTRLR